MAQLKDTVVSGSLRATDSLLTTTLQTKILKAPTESNGTTYGAGTSGQVLKSNGTSAYWASDSSGVTSVTIKTSSPLSGGSNTAVTSTGTWTISLGTVGVGNGGTNITTYTIGDILYCSAANTLSKLGGNTTTTRKFLRSVATTAGTAVAPAWDTVTKTDVGLSNVTNDAQVKASLGTAKGDMVYWSASGTPARLAIGTAGYTLQATANGPAWTQTVAVGNGGTGKTSWTKGGIVYASATNALSQVADGTASKLLRCTASATYDWLSYDSASTASTIVYRDASKNFSAGTITATLSGNASSATKANITSNKYGVAYYSDTAGTFATTGQGTSGYLLQGGGTSAAPSWIQATDANTASTIVKRSSTGTFTISGITATGSPGFYNEVAAGTYSYLRLKSGTGTWDIAVKSDELSGSLQFRPSEANQGIYVSTAGRFYTPAVQATWVDVATTTSAAFPRVKFWYNNSTSVWETGIYDTGSSNTYAYRIYYGTDLGFNMVASTKTIHPGASWQWGSPSSRSLKNTITPLKDYGTILDQLKPVSFYYNEDLDRHLNLGLIYEDTINLIPEICRGTTDPSTYNINYTALVPILLKEIQSLRKRTRDLEIQLSFLTHENILKE